MVGLFSGCVVLLLLCIGQAHANLVVHSPENCPASVDRNNTTCLTLNMAFQQLAARDLGSNTTLELAQGVHVVENATVIQDLLDMQMVGLGEASDVIVTCSKGVGLVFFNISGLMLSSMTIRGCGLNDTDKLFSISSTFIDSFQHPLMVSVGVLVMSCANVVMRDVNFTNNIGYGLLAINMVGNSSFTRTNFVSNYPSTCVIDPKSPLTPGGAGGGAFFLFMDYKADYELPNSFGSTLQSSLAIKDSEFTENYACRLDTFLVLFSQLPRTISLEEQRELSLVGAGGLSIVLGSGTYHVSFEVDSCVFQNNTSTFHAAAMQTIQFENTDNCHVTVKNTIFETNGGRLLSDYGPTALDPFGAVVVGFSLPIPSEQLQVTVEEKAEYIKHASSSFVADNCTFLYNMGTMGGGIGVVSFGPSTGAIKDQVNVTNSYFEGNQASYGPGMYLRELSYSSFEPGVAVFLENITAQLNTMHVLGSLSGTQTGVFDIQSMDVYFGGFNSFFANFVTVISAYSAIVTFSGESHFMCNEGVMGGAMFLDVESFLLLNDGAHVVLEDNTALVAGGGIYVNTDSDSYYDCFLYFGESFTPFCNVYGDCNEGGPGTTLQFINNYAPYGRALFGSTFSYCQWGRGLQLGIGLSTLPVTSESVNETLTVLESFAPVVNFTPPVTRGDNIINTIPAILLNENSKDRVKDNIMPGQEFEVDLGAFDQLLQPVPLTIFSQVRQQEGETSVGVHASIGETDRYLLTGGTDFTSVPVTIFGNEGQSLNVTISTDEANVHFTFLVRLSSCQKGFQFNQSRHICECLVNWTLSDVECQPDGNISYPTNAWIGQDDNNDFILHECIADYCESKVTVLNLSEADVQCSNHRSGVLCGECLPGYSRVLGSSACEWCTNNGYLALIVFFAFLGIILVVAISTLKLTVTDGYLNGFIFYGNIMSLMTYEFFPSGIAATTLALISPFNLDLGIKTCFYNGMTQMAVVALEFVFPFYLAGILLAIMVFSRFWSRFKIFKDYNAAHVFVTLLLLSYSSIIRTCSEILGFVTIDSPSGTLVRWRGDPNVEYFSGLHLFLSLFSILLLLVLVPLPIPLLCPSMIFRVKRFVRLKPLVDAFLAPFVPRKRFWLGFRLIVRLVVLLTVYLGTNENQLIFTAIYLLLLITLQSYLQPFSTASRNIIDLSLVLNLALVSVAALYKNPDGLKLDSDIKYITLTFSIIAFVEFLFLLVYYILKAVPGLTDWAFLVAHTVVEKWKNRKKTTMFSTRRQTARLPRHTSVAMDSQIQDVFQTADAINLRETLLD